MPRLPNCTCREAQLALVGCCCGAEEWDNYLTECAADVQAEADHEQNCIEASRSIGSRFEFSKDLDDTSPF
jgi:hypothetical protein